MSAPARADFRALGTGCVVVVDDETALDAARERVDAELALIDRTCSRFRDDSELSVLNRASADTMAVSDTLAAAIAVALRGAELTGGDLDPTLGSALRVLGYDRDFGAVAPNAGAVMKVRVARNWRRLRIDPTTRTVTRPAGVEIDLGATAKAWAADRAAAAAATVARCGVLVSLGGDIATAGPPPVEGWSVRVTDSHAASVDAPGITVAIHSGGLATSSTTARRWQRGNMVLHHIIDPETSQPAREVWRTVSVVAQHCVDANIASTTAIIRGDRALEWFQDVRLPARLVAVDGHVVTCNGWPDDGTAS